MQTGAQVNLNKVIFLIKSTAITRFALTSSNYATTYMLCNRLLCHLASPQSSETVGSVIIYVCSGTVRKQHRTHYSTRLRKVIVYGFVTGLYGFSKVDACDSVRCCQNP